MRLTRLLDAEAATLDSVVTSAGIESSGTEYAVVGEFSFNIFAKQRICQMSTELLQHTTQRHGPFVQNGVSVFRVWAPERRSIDVVLVDPEGREQKKLPLAREADGYFS